MERVGVPGGLHEISFTYQKDKYVYEGSDEIIIDDLTVEYGEVDPKDIARSITTTQQAYVAPPTEPRYVAAVAEERALLGGFVPFVLAVGVVVLVMMVLSCGFMIKQSRQAKEIEKQRKAKSKLAGMFRGSGIDTSQSRLKVSQSQI